MATISYKFSLTYQDAPGSCTVTTKFNDVAQGDTTTFEGSSGFPPKNITGLIDCSVNGPSSPVHQIKIEGEGGSGGNTWSCDISNDGINWTSLGTQTGVINAFASMTWTISGNSTVRYYRVGNGGSGGIANIADMRIYDSGGTEITGAAPNSPRRHSRVIIYQ